MVECCQARIRCSPESRQAGELKYIDRANAVVWPDNAIEYAF